MKKINWRIVNIAFWVEIIVSYVLPFRVVNETSYTVGFPIPFITVYASQIGVNPMMSMHLNPIGLVANAAIVYFIIALFVKGQKYV